MNLIERGLFYSRLFLLLYKFFSESRVQDSSLKAERERFLKEVFGTFDYDKKGERDSELEEIAANYHPEFCRKWQALVGRYVIAPQFTDIVVDGKENLAQGNNEVIAFVSSHRSLYDVPIESIVISGCIENSLIYSTGSNLAKGPFKYGLQKLGGALIDRKKLKQRGIFTTRLTEHYFTCLSLDGINTLSYLEGTRSRSTAFDEIYTGFLQPAITAQRARPDLIYKVNPIVVSYDRVPEDLELIRVKKASGREKSLSEKIMELTKIHTWVGHNFGNVYVTFCEPIYLRDFVESEKEDSSIRKGLRERIGRVFKKRYKITPFMLMAHSVLNPRREVSVQTTYEETARNLEFSGFNVVEGAENLFSETVDHPFTRRFLKRRWQDLQIKNEALAGYYAAHVRDVL